MLGILLIISGVAAIGSFADALLKLGTKKLGKVVRLNRKEIKKALKNRWVLLGIGLMIFNTMIWLRVFSMVELSIPYPMYATRYVFAAVWSIVIFREVIPLRRWVGIFIIIFGVYMVSKG